MFVLGIMVLIVFFLCMYHCFATTPPVFWALYLSRRSMTDCYVEFNCNWSFSFGHFVFCPCICIFGLYCVPFFASTCSLFCLLVLYISSLTFLLISDCLRYVFGGHWIITWHQYALLMILWWFKTNAVSFYSVLYNEI